MKLPRHIAAIAAVLVLSNGHYIWFRAALNGEWFPPLQYIRNVSSLMNDTSNILPWPHYKRTYIDPVYPDDSAESIRCGRHNMASAQSTDVLNVKAGDEISLAPITQVPADWRKVDWESEKCKREGCGGDIYHEGPVQAYLSLAPSGDVTEYDGSGDWFKIYSAGLKRSNASSPKLQWQDHFKLNVTIQIPPTTPSGQYLLRAEQVYPLDEPHNAQIFVNYMHINVDGSDDGDPGPMIQIPEAFPWDDPGILISGNMRNGNLVDDNYRAPGGPVWNWQDDD